MLAALMDEPGKLEMRNIPTPEPKTGEVLLKVEYSALCGTDQRVLRGEKPVSVPIIGHEISGVVEEVDNQVTGIAKGERYAVQTVIGCGECVYCKKEHQIFCEPGFKAIGYAWNGGFAEHMIMPKEGVEQKCLIPLPDEIEHPVGTMLEPISCCVNGFRYIPEDSLDTVVILGSGIIGTFNALVAHAKGAKKIIMVNRSQSKLDLLSKLDLPIDHFINSSETDPVDWVMDFTKGIGANAVIASASSKSLIPTGIKMLARGGHLSMFAGVDKKDPLEPLDINLIHYRELNLHGANSSVRRDYLEAIELLKSGKIPGKNLVTHEFPLSNFMDAVATQADPNIDSLKILIKNN